VVSHDIRDSVHSITDDARDLLGQPEQDIVKDCPVAEESRMI
jgi:hypothetical protein